MTQSDDQIILTRTVLDEVITETRSLYEELRPNPKITAALRKRLLTLFSAATIKMLDQIEKLTESDKIISKMSVKTPVRLMTNDHFRDVLKAHGASA
jgi:LAS superfamily LD-carboxypeptidase LdcB